MPTWAIFLLSLVSIIIILMGVVNFPYLPMFFGVYAAERYSFRGKFIVLLIWLFPPVTIIFLYIAWVLNGLVALAPFLYIALVWSIRANKRANKWPANQYSSKQENLNARLDELEFRWKSWLENSSENNYLLFSFFAPSIDAANQLRETITNTETMHSEIEQSSDNNRSLTVYARIKLKAIDKSAITVITERVIDKAWSNNCEVLSLDVMQDEK